jgi:hypothetical protein
LGEAWTRERVASKATSDAGCVGASSAMLEVDMATIWNPGDSEEILSYQPFLFQPFLFKVFMESSILNLYNKFYHAIDTQRILV